MSKDIRSFFALQGGSSKKTKHAEKPSTKLPKAIKVLISDDDDDIIPESPEVRVKSKEKILRKKRRIVDDSSDEEIFDKKTCKESKKSKRNGHAKKLAKSPLTEVKAADIFGNAPIKRTEVPKNTEKFNKSSINAELTIHSDDDFEKTLLQLDEPLEIQSEVAVNGKQGNNIEKYKEITLGGKVLKQLTGNNNLKAKEETNTFPKEKTKYFECEDSKRNRSENHVEVSEKKTDYRSRKSISPNKSSKPNEEKKITEPLEKNAKKRDFSEFLDIGSQREDDKPSPKNKKLKSDVTLNESVISDEERYEKKRHSAILYQKYLNRTGPKNPGSKEIPEGTPNCLKDLSFVLTGVLESFERDEVTEAIQKYGGTFKSGISRKVTHVIAGDDAGPAKLAKAEELGLKILNEDQFLELIIDLSKLSTIKKVPPEKHIKKDKPIKNTEREHSKPPKNSSIKKEKPQEDKSTTKDSSEINLEIKKEPASMKTKKTPVKEVKVSSFYKNQSEPEEAKPSSSKAKEEHVQIVECKEAESKTESKSSDSIRSITTDSSALMWVDKYKPKTVKQVIGQNGDASVAKKLTNWLMKWYINRREKLSKPSPWAKNDDGAFFKAALLSGPPGIGKTTTVALVCAELGFDFVEFNASDTRSKNLIKDQITELLTTTSLSGFVKGQTGKKAVSKKHVLVMDEVDGMAGNEDRGGLQELISLIKLSAVPIVCMCNDRNSPKMRTLVNYCYDLRLNRPRVDQIKSAMMSVCFKEGVKISSDALAQLIVSANQDIRQTLNLLSMWSVNDKSLTGDGIKKDTQNVKKDMKLGPWEVVRKVFSAEEHKTMSIHDKSDLFFYDYSIAPLFVQENYLQSSPHCPKNEVLKRLSQAADSISLGDTVDAKIRSRNAWSLLPVQALYSSVLPGYWMSGHLAGQIQFPAWLGKNSRTTKMQRLAQEIHAHTRLSASGSKSSIFLDYCQQLRDAIVLPLVKDKAEGIPRSLAVLEAYHLLREDLDSLTELATWPGQRDPMLLVESKVKAAMTRTYNKEAVALPYTQVSVKKSRSNVNEADEVLPGAEEEEEMEQESDSDPDNDAMIKKKKKSSQNKESGKSDAKAKGKKGKGKS